ncbi:restriction endonuclease [Bradyrhizobium jicamae]|uniref:Restriction endonuclease n=1 Tax=Bradyrhizobium jicamae TaxID=280332 RepID=A0ABS5FB12_9BRAD|nr:restriction endonuclease [Bradyrhizobium jicamae]MBR0793971.1 restriction endonuclease [Bradyrhizobium jicamae]
MALVICFCLLLILPFLAMAYVGLEDANAKCPHGVRGGRTRKLCFKCIEEQKAAAQELLRQQAIHREADLLRDRERRRLYSSLVPNLDELRRLDPFEFEDAVARMFERLGYSVRQTPKTKDGGRDAILTKDGVKYLVECKKYGDGLTSSRPDLQKFHSAIMSDKAKSGFFVTSGTFTKDAIDWAAKHPVVDLVDSHKLVDLMFASKPAASGDDSYQSACKNCGDIVTHRLRAPLDVVCSKGHVVSPPLKLHELLAGVPFCAKCGIPMRLAAGRRGKFWGCYNYSRTPRCTYTQRYRD